VENTIPRQSAIDGMSKAYESDLEMSGSESIGSAQSQYHHNDRGPQYHQPSRHSPPPQFTYGGSRQGGGDIGSSSGRAPERNTRQYTRQEDSRVSSGCTDDIYDGIHHTEDTLPNGEGAHKTLAGTPISNRKNSMLYTSGLTASISLQWVFEAGKLWTLGGKVPLFYHTIPEKCIAELLHDVMLDLRRVSNTSSEGSYQMRVGPNGGSVPGSRQARAGGEGQYTVPSIHKVPTSVSAEGDNQHHGGVQDIPGVSKLTQKRGLITGESQEAINVLSILEMNIREENRQNHHIQILEVSLNSFSNPLPIPVAIEWEKNDCAHFEFSGGKKYLFVLPPETTCSLSPPRTWDLRPKLSIEATRLGAMWQKDNMSDLLVERQSVNFAYVYAERILYKYISSAHPNMRFEMTEIEGEPVAKIPKNIVMDAQSRIQDNIQTLKTITYNGFSFKLVPLIGCIYGTGECIPSSTTPGSVIQKLFEQKYPGKNVEELLQMVHAHISFRYL
jgi:hypothetical protein